MQLLRIASDLFDYLDGSDDKKTSRKRWASMDNTVRSKTVSVVLFTIFTIFLHCPRISSYVPYPPHHYFESPDLISQPTTPSKAYSAVATARYPTPATADTPGSGMSPTPVTYATTMRSAPKTL